MVAANTFSGALLDRASDRRGDPGWVHERLADPSSRALPVRAEGPYVRCDGERCRPALVPVPVLAAGETLPAPVLLGLDRHGALFAVDVEDRSDLAARLDGTAPMSLREAGARVAPHDGGLMAYATAMLNWHRTHRFCPRCGGPTHSVEAGHARICERCGESHHPRTDPVVIMLVHDGDRVLLGRQPSWPEQRYSALAGFVEPGESLEEAVAREVSEESDVAVEQVRYRSSQPWPFPASLMLGFRARYAGGEPSARDGELADVRWFGREELKDAERQRGDLLLPPPIAIARRLIEEWLHERPDAPAPAGPPVRLGGRTGL